MKIFSKRRLEKIRKLIEGGEEDRKVAAEIIFPTKKEVESKVEYPSYKLEVGFDKITLYVKKGRGEDWNKSHDHWYNPMSPSSKEDAITYLKRRMTESKPDYVREIQAKKFKKYTINL